VSCDRTVRMALPAPFTVLSTIFRPQTTYIPGSNYRLSLSQSLQESAGIKPVAIRALRLGEEPVHARLAEEQVGRRVLEHGGAGRACRKQNIAVAPLPPPLRFAMRVA
jgi:hypothetical protein